MHFANGYGSPPHVPAASSCILIKKATLTTYETTYSKRPWD